MTKIKSIDLYDADHPFRRTAIDIIESVIEPLLQRGINGEKYYQLENDLTEAINKRLNKITKKPVLPDITPTNGIEEKEFDDDDFECTCNIDENGDCNDENCDCECHN